MDNNTPVKYDFSIVKTLSLAESLCERSGFSCVTDIACFVALVKLEESSIHKHLMKIQRQSEDDIKQNGKMSEIELKKMNESIIDKAATQIFNDYFSVSTNQEISQELRFDTINFNVYVSAELMKIMNKAAFITKEYYEQEEVGCDQLFSAFAQEMPDVYQKLLNLCDIKLTKSNTKPKSSDKNKPFDRKSVDIVIPRELLGCLTILNDEFSPNEEYCPILGRDKELIKLMRILAKNTKRNAVLIGEPGVGKTALVEKLTWNIVTGNCPEVFKDYLVVCLDVNSIIAGTQFRGSAEARFDSLIQFLEDNPSCILFIDEIHNLLGAGACRDGDLDLANAMKPILARGKTQVIGATTSAEYENYFSRDGALKRRFEKIVINEPKINEIYPMIENKIKRLSESHGTSISRDLIDNIIFLASCFNFETKNPDRTLDLIDKSMAVASLAGKKEVSKEDVLVNFDVNKEIFNKTPLNIKIGLAYHEAGHYILHRFSDELYDHKVLAVSIMPADDYYGVNVFEIDSEVMPSRTREYYIQLIASKLAGRVAEKMYSNKLSAGASSDLSQATEIAKNMITRYGLAEEFTKNRVYLRESQNPMYNDSVIDRINEQIDAIVDEAWNFAENMLLEKEKYLEALVKKLLEEGMLSANDIDKLFEEIDNEAKLKEENEIDFSDDLVVS